MKRRLFNLLSILSLVLFATTAGFDAAWAFRDVSDVMMIRHNGDTFWCLWALSKLTIVHCSPKVARHLTYPMKWRFSFLGFRYSSWRGNLFLTYVELPYFWTLILTGFLPVLWISKWMRHRRRRQSGLCRSCGYDLRATPRRCPECGAVVETPG